MANKSTFSRLLPRDMVKFTSTQGNPDYKKSQLVKAIDFKTGLPRLKVNSKGESEEFQVRQILPDYDRMLRLLMIDAHKSHKQFKLRRLSREMVQDLAKAEQQAEV